MDKRVENFLDTHRISVLSVLQENNIIHSATLHYAVDQLYTQFVFLTDKQSEKCRSLVNGNNVNASLVIGFSEEEWITMQFRGSVKLLTKEDEISGAWNIYNKKYIGSEKYKTDKESFLLVFKPNWWRYTKLRPKPMLIINSENTNELPKE